MLDRDDDLGIGVPILEPKTAEELANEQRNNQTKTIKLNRKDPNSEEGIKAREEAQREAEKEKAAAAAKAEELSRKEEILNPARYYASSKTHELFPGVMPGYNYKASLAEARRQLETAYNELTADKDSVILKWNSASSYDYDVAFQLFMVSNLYERPFFPQSNSRGEISVEVTKDFLNCCLDYASRYDTQIINPDLSPLDVTNSFNDRLSEIDKNTSESSVETEVRDMEAKAPKTVKFVLNGLKNTVNKTEDKIDGKIDEGLVEKNLRNIKSSIITEQISPALAKAFFNANEKTEDIFLGKLSGELDSSLTQPRISVYNNYDFRNYDVAGAGVILSILTNKYTEPTEILIPLSDVRNIVQSDRDQATKNISGLNILLQQELLDRFDLEDLKEIASVFKNKWAIQIHRRRTD